MIKRALTLVNYFEDYPLERNETTEKDDACKLPFFRILYMSFLNQSLTNSSHYERRWNEREEVRIFENKE